MRVDKWLWAVRLFKTRSLASQACRLNQVRIGHQTIKPSRLLRIGDELHVDQGPLVRSLRVIGVVERRVSAKLVATYLEDLTPTEELEKARREREAAARNRVYQGVEGGRPRKKDRRQMEAFESQDTQ